MSKLNLEGLMGAMRREAEAFDHYVEGQREFEKAMLARDWPGLERAMARLEGSSAEITDAEATRASFETFYRLETGIMTGSTTALAFAIPEPERSAFTDLHRRLRVAAMRARLENDSLGEYATASRNLLGAVLEELFPEKKGRMYGKSGRTVQPGHDALVLNTAL